MTLRAFILFAVGIHLLVANKPISGLFVLACLLM